MEYLKPVLAALSAILTGLKKLKEPLSTIGAFLMGRRQGHLEQQNEQQEQDLEALDRAARARARVKRDPGGMQHDSYNRDAD